ncbi:hypothetical protein NDU88_009587 [Pleurodeles waltl]|uniref:Uncharacterized protein n=1 Tax=Pleurodeles waltl TaxID=8319 RepID=A0AAV7QRZ0_PLEWA|nr:hypothetical protein NDU88_009587 [Pleurodeles waltl]
MYGPVVSWARLQAPTGPSAQVSPLRGGTAPSRGVAAPPAPSQQSIGPGLATQKSPRLPALLHLWHRPSAPGTAHFGRSGLSLHGIAQSPRCPPPPDPGVTAGQLRPAGPASR